MDWLDLDKVNQNDVPVASWAIGLIFAFVLALGPHLAAKSPSLTPAIEQKYLLACTPTGHPVLRVLITQTLDLSAPCSPIPLALRSYRNTLCAANWQQPGHHFPHL